MLTHKTFIPTRLILSVWWSQVIKPGFCYVLQVLLSISSLIITILPQPALWVTCTVWDNLLISVVFLLFPEVPSCHSIYMRQEGFLAHQNRTEGKMYMCVWERAFSFSLCLKAALISSAGCAKKWAISSRCLWTPLRCYLFRSSWHKLEVASIQILVAFWGARRPMAWAASVAQPSKGCQAQGWWNPQPSAHSILLLLWAILYFKTYFGHLSKNWKTHGAWAIE